MTRVPLILAAAAAILGLGAMPAFAQARVFVSGHGSDSNPCSLSAPCRSFQHAHDTVAAGGEIVALDAAGYGPLIISKAVTVSAIGIEASITSNSATGAALSIGAGASDTVSIRGLTIIAGTLANDGIDINAAKSVTISDCSISGFSANGISVQPTNSSLDVELRGVTATGNGSMGLNILGNGTGNVTVLATDSSFNGNANGGVIVNGHTATGTLNVTLSVAAAANGAFGGILAEGFSGLGPVVVMVTGSKLVNNNGHGLVGSGAPVTMFVDRTQISGNTGNGWGAQTGAVVKSYTNNEVNGNGSDALNGVTQITSE